MLNYGGEHTSAYDTLTGGWISNRVVARDMCHCVYDSERRCAYLTALNNGKPLVYPHKRMRGDRISRRMQRLDDAGRPIHDAPDLIAVVRVAAETLEGKESSFAKAYCRSLDQLVAH